MITLCCPVGEPPEQAIQSWKLIPDMEIVWIDPENLRSYWDEFAKRWGSDDLLSVERNIILHDNVLPQLQSCDRDWCVFPSRWCYHGLGCTYFSKELQYRIPLDSIASLPDYCDYCKGINSTCYWHLDGKFLRACTFAGYERHYHYPLVGYKDTQPGCRE